MYVACTGSFDSQCAEGHKLLYVEHVYMSTCVTYLLDSFMLNCSKLNVSGFISRNNVYNTVKSLSRYLIERLVTRQEQ